MPIHLTLEFFPFRLHLFRQHMPKILENLLIAFIGTQYDLTLFVLGRAGFRPPRCRLCQHPDEFFFTCDRRCHARCGFSRLHRTVQRTDVPVHDPDALAGGAGILLRPFSDFDALDEQPQQLRCQFIDGGVLLGLLDEGVHIGDRGFQPL